MQLFILADDLTGANDSGVQLSKQGFRSNVWFDASRGEEEAADVVIYDTDSRAAQEETAYERARQAVSFLENRADVHLYKKMDSTLRGNIGSELRAASDGYRPELVVVSPAFPKLKRQTINGTLFVDRQPVEQTEFGRDPKTPVTESHIPTLLKGHAAGQIQTVDTHLLSLSMPEVKAAVAQALDEGKTWFVCDAETEEHLRKTAAVFSSLHKRTLWAGSAGLIEYLPDALGLKPPKETEEERREIRQTLTVSASLSGTTKKQLARVKEMNDVCMLEMDPADLIQKTYNVQDILDEVKQKKDQKHFLLYVDSCEENRKAAEKLSVQLNLDKNQIGESISRELGSIARSLLGEFPDIQGLVLTGGDTAKAVCSELGMDRMELRSEIETGLPIGKLSNENSEYWAVTKAGGFGNEQSLVNALNYMTGEVLEYESKS
ncbi:four-carbon acid sugar kinase family protein [Fictibacillus fluitans]|uniref:Four-carbon acid sugar kinase family protein n=1 Tax=Fictibacillus fluitans TaxID=3058422 RepID=A0ABT8HVX3_9BACL|nr:four-carbon acid sugar kinase family protein [Fictibacillus sp. NE201]MDN4524869.1 four-carbon acid sugar kinase family protein [Fictibacillus sp. NE201]